MEITAQLNYLRMSPRKVRLLANLIKGMEIKRAELELQYAGKRSAEPLLKLLRSAVANAKHNFQLAEEGLYIKNILVNQGPILKRSMPRAFGRAAPIRKRTSHVYLVLDTRAPVKIKPRKLSKKEEPLVREVTREDIKEEFADDQAKAEREIPKAKPKSRTPDFVKRVFKRKVI